MTPATISFRPQPADLANLETILASLRATNPRTNTSDAMSAALANLAEKIRKEQKMNKTVTLVNPWSHVDTDAMTWAQIVNWAKSHVHQRDYDHWIEAAKVAWEANDGETLGQMIIGS